MGSKRDSELCWTAFRYICGELGAEESAAFEQQLDHDQAAREAVAEAVELAGAVARLEPGSALVLRPSRRAGFRSIPRWTALAAASLLLALLVKGLWFSARQGGATPVAGAPSAVALAWSGVHEDDDETESLLAWLDTNPAPLDTPESAEAGVPDWMLAAAALDGGSPGVTPNRQEN